MKLFLDTSCLLKLYNKEKGTEELELIFSTIKITKVFLSEISKVELTSSLWKKVRTKEITISEALVSLQLFNSDVNRYTFIAAETAILEQARSLISKYKTTSLRTLDSIQLATCTSLSQQADLFLTADELLKTLLKAEGLPTEI